MSREQNTGGHDEYISADRRCSFVISFGSAPAALVSRTAPGTLLSRRASPLTILERFALQGLECARFSGQRVRENRWLLINKVHYESAEPDFRTADFGCKFMIYRVENISAPAVIAATPRG